MHGGADLSSLGSHFTPALPHPMNFSESHRKNELFAQGKGGASEGAIGGTAFVTDEMRERNWQPINISHADQLYPQIEFAMSIDAIGPCVDITASSLQKGSKGRREMLL